MNFPIRIATVAAAGLFTAALSASPLEVQPAPKPAGAEPEHITVQHLLIAFSGTLPGKPVSRTMAEAEKLAGELLAKARAGANFDELVKANTDDAFPGIYSMSNTGVPQAIPGEFARAGMVPAFGNVGFKLKVGEYGLAPFDPAASPFGWHIIKRVK